MSLFRYRMAFRLTNRRRVVVTTCATSGRRAATAVMRYASVAFGGLWSGDYPVIERRTRIS